MCYLAKTVCTWRRITLPHTSTFQGSGNNIQCKDNVVKCNAAWEFGTWSVEIYMRNLLFWGWIYVYWKSGKFTASNSTVQAETWGSQVTMLMLVFWVVTPCELEGRANQTTQKTNLNIVKVDLYCPTWWFKLKLCTKKNILYTNTKYGFKDVKVQLIFSWTVSDPAERERERERER
jgi:hypothetical protein